MIIRSLLVRGIICACVAVSVAHATTPLFKTAASSGGCMVERAGKKNIPLRTSMQLMAGDKIVVPAGGYCGLIHANGHTLELRTEGTFDVSTLAQSVPKGTSGIATRLEKYVASEMGKTSTPIEITDTHQEDMETTGSVERLSGGEKSSTQRIGDAAGALDAAAPGALPSGLGKILKPSAPAKSTASSTSITGVIRGYWPVATSIMDTTVVFSWRPTAGISTYSFNIVSGRGTSVFARDISDTLLSLDLATLNLERENCYYWTVCPKDDPSKVSAEQCLFILSEETAKPLRDTVKSLEEEAGNSNSALVKLALASFYEDHNLLTRADLAYQEAIRRAPRVPEYRRTYQEFLRRIGASR